MVDIDKPKFRRYESLRQSGVTNMMEVKTVMKLARLTKDEVLDIMSKYCTYHEQFISA